MRSQYIGNRSLICPSCRIAASILEELNELIGDIYDTVLDPSLWAAVARQGRRISSAAPVRRCIARTWPIRAAAFST